MNILSCPVALIVAPVEIVLSLLEPQNWEKWNRGSIDTLRPEGKIIKGQTALISIRDAFIPVKIKIIVVDVDRVNRKIRYDVYFPFGFKVEEDLHYIPLTKTTCRVNYNCNFIFQDGLKGLIVKKLLGDKISTGPRDSLKRLKTTAEREYKNNVLSTEIS